MEEKVPTGKQRVRREGRKFTVYLAGSGDEARTLARRDAAGGCGLVTRKPSRASLRHVFFALFLGLTKLSLSV